MAEKSDAAGTAKDRAQSVATVQELLQTAFDNATAFGAGATGESRLSIRIALDGLEVSVERAYTSATPSAIAAMADTADEPETRVLFNSEGHQAIALVAMQDLEARGKQNTIKAINDILAADPHGLDPTEAAVFPDEVLRNSNPETKPFHFVDIELVEGGASTPPLPPEPHVLSKLAEFTSKLQAAGASDEERFLALCWLFHLFGDIHQPLHCVDRISELHAGGDRGGNSFKLTGQFKNLHSLWDSSVNVFDNIDNDSLATTIRQTHSRESVAQDLAITDPEKWARASFQIAETQAYTLVENASNPPKPPANYLKNMQKIGRRQAALAGYRLADRFELLFP